MDCNKDEASRAKEIAERKFIERNYSAAKKFALKAQNLYPRLEGLSQMVTTFDVYIAMESKVNGEMDWYGILGVDHVADEETIRKNYKKLALTLHPDKNKSLGAEGAFKWISEAWSVLSDKEKRLAYNQMRFSRRYQQRVSTQTHRGPSVPANIVASQARNNNYTQSKTGPVQGSFPPLKMGTFWTLCIRCGTHYEHLKIYLNRTLRCPNCQETFLASEMAPPPKFLKSYYWSRQPAVRNSAAPPNLEGGGGPGSLRFHPVPGSIKGASVVEQASVKGKREREKSPTLGEWKRSHSSPMKKKTANNDRANGNGAHTTMKDGRA